MLFDKQYFYCGAALLACITFIVTILASFGHFVTNVKDTFTGDGKGAKSLLTSVGGN